MPAADCQLDLLAPPPALAVAARLDATLRPRWKKRRVSHADIARLEAQLRGRGWRKRADLGTDDRQLRLIAEAADGAILSYPGSPGYRHFDEASPAEWDHADAAITHQISAMVRRRNAYRRRRRRVESSRRHA